MQATLVSVDATPEPVELHRETFDLACAAKGAWTIGARARLAGVDRATLNRWYSGPVAVLLPVALQVGRRLGKPVEELWRPVSEASK